MEFEWNISQHSLHWEFSLRFKRWWLNCEESLMVGSDYGPQAEVAQGVGPGPLVEL